MGIDMKYFAFLVIVIFVGCASIPPPAPTEPIQDTFIIAGNLSEVWTVILDSLTTLSIPIRVIEKESGLISTDMVIFASGYNCLKTIDEYAVHPTIILDVWDSGRLSLNIIAIQKEEGLTQIKIVPHIETFESNVTKSWHICQSRGTFERNFATAIQSKFQ